MCYVRLCWPDAWPRGAPGAQQHRQTLISQKEHSACATCGFTGLVRELKVLTCRTTTQAHTCTVTRRKKYTSKRHKKQE
jgi:hypothetical protein